MKLTTAVKVLQKECDFLGMDFFKLLADIQKYGRMVYSEKAVKAAEIFEFEGRHLHG